MIEEYEIFQYESENDNKTNRENKSNHTKLSIGFSVAQMIFALSKIAFHHKLFSDTLIEPKISYIYEINKQK